MILQYWEKGNNIFFDITCNCAGFLHNCLSILLIAASNDVSILSHLSEGMTFFGYAGCNMLKAAKCFNPVLSEFGLKVFTEYSYLEDVSNYMENIKSQASVFCM